MTTLRVLTQATILMGYLLPFSCNAAGGSGTINDHSITYTSEWERRSPPDKVQAEVNVDGLLVDLNSVQGKYKVLPLRLSNYTDAPISLSNTDDKIEIAISSRRVLAILDITNQGGLTLESNERDLKRALAYPTQLDSMKSRVIYVFVPQAQFSSIIDGLDYSIKSIGRTLRLRRPAAMAN